jgi:hypothetical protein
MYIELWQLGFVAGIGLSAYFSFKQGQKEGVQAGVHIVINDLHEKGIIAIYKNHEQGEVVVGRYDEDEFELVNETEVDYDDEDDHW